MQWNCDELLALKDYELIMEARDAVIDEIRNSSSEDDLEKIAEIRFYLLTASIFDMEIPVGKSVGIVGPSGAGKTTAVDILLGLLKIQGGKILCNNQDVMENYASWLSNIGYIAQNIYLTDDPIRDSIAFGVNKDEIDDARVWAVLEEAQMKEFVESLPEGLDTAVGERGVRISGGQRQRLGIARALYHNPDILVFDEATSALDTETETAIMEAIDKFHGRKTLIIIAHRLRTIENCDLIYKVENGKIAPTTLNKEE